eukprot:CAMPEP_0117606150 /NCGR_PEP_ID=MMETSP0784-20121206/79563_1 /TAXON_ID=39447 /ORGANISM="" /LENGTH=86 /DNA_ID=CAMNT_0005409221 /DNA_START=51 /DNA_END=308 /DNA_ORIENTATION=+
MPSSQSKHGAVLLGVGALFAAPWAFSTTARGQQNLQRQDLSASLQGSVELRLSAQGRSQGQSNRQAVGAMALCAGAVGLAASRRAR